MDFFEVIEKRYSVRAYQTKPVEQEKLGQILEAAKLAPTAANLTTEQAGNDGTDQRCQYCDEIDRIHPLTPSSRPDPGR